MVLIAVFGVAPLIAVPLSGLTARTALPAHSTADSGILAVTAAPAPFPALFAHGRRVSFPTLRAYGKNPARALGPAPEPDIPLASVARPRSRTAPPASAGRPSFPSDAHHSKENGHART
ncbi:hypothetical protein [Streptomyces sp. Wb2n-11]|uniref:hypothetical protein n=1 Tax=Streptomyces sp. Wb2n-11 TaxID=1030533 RepID=UPI000AC5174F|nr:hypothetical protein [Streptomyces sp. Wb2n-11]